MILIADSGSTKTLWAACADGRIRTTHTTLGINPYYQTDEQMRATMAEAADWASADHVERLCFYGAGCTADKIPALKRLLEIEFPHAEVQVDRKSVV